MRYISLKTIALFLFFSTVATAQAMLPADSAAVKKHTAADSLLTSAMQNFDASKTTAAFADLLRAQAMYSKAEDKAGQFAVFKAFGDFYYKNQLWGEAEGYYELAVPLTPSPDTTTVSAEMQLALARINIAMDKGEFAREYAGNALTQFTYKGLKGRMAECQIILASIKRKNQNYNQAETIVLNYALPLVSAPADRPYRIASFDELGHIYHERKSYSQAKWFYIQANSLARTSGNTLAIVNSLINLGKVKTDIKDFNLAIRDFKEAEDLAKKNNFLEQQANVCKAFATVYQKSGNRGLADRYTSKFSTLSDSLKNMQTAKETAITQAKAEAELLVNPPEKTAPETAKAPESEIVAYFLTGILVIVLLAGLILYLKRKNKSGL